MYKKVDSGKIDLLVNFLSFRSTKKKVAIKPRNSFNAHSNVSICIECLLISAVTILNYISPQHSVVLEIIASPLENV